MKLGDLIMFRPNFYAHDMCLWSEPCLVIDRYLPPDQALWIILLRDGEKGVIDESNYDIEVINESR